MLSPLQKPAMTVIRFSANWNVDPTIKSYFGDQVYDACKDAFQSEDGRIKTSLPESMTLNMVGLKGLTEGTPQCQVPIGMDVEDSSDGTSGQLWANVAWERTPKQFIQSVVNNLIFERESQLFPANRVDSGIAKARGLSAYSRIVTALKSNESALKSLDSRISLYYAPMDAYLPQSAEPRDKVTFTVDHPFYRKLEYTLGMEPEETVEDFVARALRFAADLKLTLAEEKRYSVDPRMIQTCGMAHFKEAREAFEAHQGDLMDLGEAVQIAYKFDNPIGFIVGPQEEVSVYIKKPDGKTVQFHAYQHPELSMKEGQTVTNFVKQAIVFAKAKKAELIPA